MNKIKRYNSKNVTEDFLQSNKEAPSFIQLN